MRTASRIVIVAALLLVLGGLCVHYGATYDDNWPHPTGDQLQERGTEPFVGERVLLFGEVRAIDGDTISIHVTDDNDAVAAELEVYDIHTRVEPGGVVQVYGVLESETVLRADRTVVVNRGPNAAAFKLGASVVGLLLAVGYFLRHWRIEIRELTFRPRAIDDKHGSEPAPDTEGSDRG
ncbi:DNA-binding protein [Natrinema zhouii]|uniref:DNA-binding protein n=1 Tax=Natrinema zhouii TaxID=1710539 RepID=A0A7D6CSB8_9EURY|nr:DNA-binding protein [Natrinema zhouii]QLK26830.1 DNA-binding protein [Natrinema zhouii]